MVKDEKKDKGSIDASKPSEPIDKAKKEKKSNETKTSTSSMALLQRADVPATATITAGTWVAEMENTNIRKNTLRIGDR